MFTHHFIRYCITFVSLNFAFTAYAQLSQSAKLDTLNIDFMNRGYFYASQSEPYSHYNGWAVSKNLPHKVTVTLKDDFPLGIVIDTTQRPLFFKRYAGYRLFVVCNAGYGVTFNAQDSRLNMWLQALDSTGVWRDIDYLPNSSCGNSYHTLRLRAKERWDFVVPLYGGTYPTKVRAALSYVDPKDKNPRKFERKEALVYSNAVLMKINPEQFWRKLEYLPTDLMNTDNE